ncbi:hypothetical protein ACFVIM_02500 [Streptomyces sp. NPDC057638]|uniref:hypothetical protein n=1 Tax=Streptomyces sp. NPDC057638 TaxID=3346190 RepID=UPI0036A76810
MTTPTPTGGGDPHPRPGTEPELLTQRAAVVLLAATVIGAVSGVLTYLSTGDTAGALLAGLTCLGVSALALNRIIGP